MRVVEVATKRPYKVHIGCHLLSACGAIVRDAAGGSKACIVSDSNIAPLYMEIVQKSLVENGYRTSSFIFPAGERSKNVITYAALLEHLASHEMTRHDVVIALGGGVTGDLAGFAASTYMRGCKFAQMPTSMLAMVDSSIGGKTAINLSAGKNLAGAFWQPNVVIADVDCLRTLNPEIFSDGCGEIVKHAILSDDSLFSSLEDRPLTLDNLLSDPEFTQKVIARNIEIKRNIILGDERETGRRKLLNLGHSIGHAVELSEQYKLGHGSCVAIGISLMAKASATRNWCAPDLPNRIEKILGNHGLTTRTSLSASDIVTAASHDKKRTSDHIDIVIPHAIGDCRIRSVSMDDFAHLVESSLRDC